jgi:hypothetical protein
MYRKRNGSLGFSITRFANAAIPRFFEDTPMRTAHLDSHRNDMCYAHQIASRDPYALDERSFYVAGIIDSESVSRKVFRILKKLGILREDGTVDTYKIGPRFTHQMATLNVNRQRDLVGMLFWWEEECQRLRKLGVEEVELTGLIEEAEVDLAQGREGEGEGVGGGKEGLDRLKFARERVRMKRRQLPSQRQPEVEADRDDILGAFHGRSKSVPNVGDQMARTLDRRHTEQDERPPMYY